METLNAAKVSCGPINAMSDLEHDPHVEARSMIVALDHPSLGAVRTVASPLRLSRSPVAYRRAPPLMGNIPRRFSPACSVLGRKRWRR